MKTKTILFSFFYIFSNLTECALDSSSFSTTIFTPQPLVKIDQLSDYEQTTFTFIKKMVLPVSCIFFYTINQEAILDTALKNPYSTIFWTLLATQQYQMKQEYKKYKQMKADVVETMQHICYLLMIGYGIYNKIKKTKDDTKFNFDMHELTLLRLFLYKAHYSWSILFDYYQEHYPKDILYEYQLEKIDLFDMLQVCAQEPEILQLIIDFYDQNYNVYNYQPILNCLEFKLKQINHKLKSYNLFAKI